MKRTHYRNGDEISLSCGCDGCSPSAINGHLCHEQGCPDAWRDRLTECRECGTNFYPTERRATWCPDCVRNAEEADERWFSPAHSTAYPCD